MGAGVEDGGGEAASAGWLVVEDEAGERGIELGWELRVERGGEPAESLVSPKS